MEVEIQDVISEIRAVDGESLLSPDIMDSIVRAVLKLVDDNEQHKQRVRSEQRITLGVSHELEED